MRKEKWDMYINTLQGHPSACNSNHTVESLKFITELIPPYKFPILLNIGVAEGLETKILHDLGYITIGIINGKLNSDIAKRKYVSENMLFIQHDMHDLPLKSESVDAVYMNHTFEHSYAPFIFLLELYCVLKPKGRMWIAMPNFKEVNDPTVSSESLISQHHPNILCRNLFGLFFKETGFKIIQDNGNGNSYLLEKQGLESVHSDVRNVILTRKSLFG